MQFIKKIPKIILMRNVWISRIWKVSVKNYNNFREKYFAIWLKYFARIIDKPSSWNVSPAIFQECFIFFQNILKTNMEQSHQTVTRIIWNELICKILWNKLNCHHRHLKSRIKLIYKLRSHLKSTISFGIWEPIRDLKSHLDSTHRKSRIPSGNWD